MVIFSLAESIGLATGNGVATSQIVSGVLWLKGPEGTLFSLVADGLAQIGQNRRQMTQEEYDWANNAVFYDTLPDREMIYVTDTVGGDGRQFTFPEAGGTISVNMGPYYLDPVNQQPDIFIHELTHAWQIHHTLFDVTWMAQELAAQLSGSTAYQYGPAGPPFNTFNPEQQAMIVQDWYSNGQDEDSPYYVYIQNNVRAGAA